MSKPKLASLKLKVSLRAALKVLRKPAYILLALASMVFASGFILWSLNLELLQYILFESPLAPIEKVEFFFNVYRDIYTTYNGIEGTGIILFSVLFGINTALLVFVIKNQGFASVPKKSGIGGFVLAIVGGGCIACGTSVLAPLLATVGATSVIFARELAVLLNLGGVVLIGYSIYKLGQLCAYIFARAEQDKH